MGTKSLLAMVVRGWAGRCRQAGAALLRGWEKCFQCVKALGQAGGKAVEISHNRGKQKLSAKGVYWRWGVGVRARGSVHKAKQVETVGKAMTNGALWNGEGTERGSICHLRGGREIQSREAESAEKRSGSHTARRGTNGDERAAGGHASRQR